MDPCEVRVAISDSLSLSLGLVTSLIQAMLAWRLLIC
jgi:hypothetical protein